MESLKTLARQVERQRLLNTLRSSLQRQIRELEEKAARMKAQWAKEENDVDQLNKTGLAGLFYGLLGKKEEKLEKETREALAAAAKYQSATAELEAAKRELAQIETELAELRDCEICYEAAKTARAAELKQSDAANGSRIAALETELGQIVSQKQELQEALAAGNRALCTTRQVQEELDSAAGWGTWDLLGGGGLITQMAKHEHLDAAQELVNRLQSQLRCFKTELADVEIHADLTVQIDEFLRFADWFFDGLIVDWTVQDRIEEAQDEIYNTACRIQQFLDRLNSLNAGILRREDEAAEELEQLLLNE